MLPVVSARNAISGFGGIAGVVTVLVSVCDPPGESEIFTVGGVTVAIARVKLNTLVVTAVNKIAIIAMPVLLK